MLVRALLSLLAGVASAFLVACGDRSSLLPSEDAERLRDRIGQVRNEVAAGDCKGAATAIRDLRGAAQLVPGEVDRRLRSRINDGIRALAKEAPQECAEARTTETIPTTTAMVPAPETTPSETQPTTPTQPTVPPETIPPETVPPETVPPEGTGGVSPEDEETP